MAHSSPPSKRTYKTNDAVLNAQTQATIAHIHEIGDAARRQADAAHAANDAHNASVEANWDSPRQTQSGLQQLPSGPDRNSGQPAKRTRHRLEPVRRYPRQGRPQPLPVRPHQGLHQRHRLLSVVSSCSMESDVEFVAVHLPQANKPTIQYDWTIGLAEVTFVVPAKSAFR